LGYGASSAAARCSSGPHTRQHLLSEHALSRPPRGFSQTNAHGKERGKLRAVRGRDDSFQGRSRDKADVSSNYKGHSGPVNAQWRRVLLESFSNRDGVLGPLRVISGIAGGQLRDIAEIAPDIATTWATRPRIKHRRAARPCAAPVRFGGAHRCAPFGRFTPEATGAARRAHTPELSV